MINNDENSQTLLNQIILNYMQEKNSQRKWRWLKRIVMIAIAIFIIYQVVAINKDDQLSRTKDHVGLIDISGAIFENQPAGSEALVKSLDDAYKSTGLKALILRINSPGGSPVQAEYMYNSLKFYQKTHPDIKVYAVCVDACASAAYYVAAAADEIYASPSSMVGSIGVVFNGFGFVDIMQKFGVSRRLHTAGVNKGFLDPFSPENPEQVQKLQTMLDIVHQQFIARVKEGRGDKLKMDDSLFSGLFWTGEQAKGLGLIDGFASSGQLAREVIKIEEIIDYTSKQSIFERIAQNIGVAFADKLPESLGLTPGFR